MSLTLAGDRFLVKTKGRGLADRLQTIDIPVSALQAFAIVPVVAAQALVARQGVQGVYDTSYDSEFLFAYSEAGKRKTKRLFVNRQHPSMNALIESLARLRPEASLLSLDPAAAHKQIGVVSAKRGLLLLLIVVLALPLIALVIALVVEGGN